MHGTLNQTTWQKRLDQGADNLLLECLRATSGERCLLVAENDEALYDASVIGVIKNRCEYHGISVEVIYEELVTCSSDFPQSVRDRMDQVEHTVFLSRLGDYLRFSGVAAPCTMTTCYAYDEALLASPYAGTSYELTVALRDRLEAELLAAKHWRITCPLGTDISGQFHWPSTHGGQDDDFLIALFPVSTFKPIACDSATGTVALSRWVAPGGSPKIDDPTLSFDGVVLCDVKNGTIDRFYGSESAAQQVSEHYDRIATTLSINRNRVHSWHVGINPQTFFHNNPDDDFERWCAVSFGSPRYLHFHTCGDEPPGEAAWSLFNCTVYVDDEIYWQQGQFVWLQRPQIRRLLDQYKTGPALTQSSLCIGVG